MSVDLDLVARARRAAEIIAPLASRIESERRLPAEAVRALAEAGLFKMVVPRRFGGAEANLPTLLTALEEIARADGAAGWCAMIGATSGLMSLYLDDETAREIYAADDAATCGVTAPLGVATPTVDGYRVSGRWPFASGCEFSRHRMGAAVVVGAAPMPNGMPTIRCMIFDAADTTVIDTWKTSGLRGTGSHDLQVEDVFVPQRRSFSLFDVASRRDVGPGIPFFGTLASSVAAVAIGIARGASDAFMALATKKQSLGARRTIAHREIVQLDVARMEAKIRGAHALLLDAVGEAEREAASGDGASLRTRAALRAAASYATFEAASAVDLAYHAGGATSVYTDSPLQRHFRDVHVATQHVMVAPSAAVLAGRVLLGVDTDTSML